ncbi:hypothetical protein ACLOJK_034194 [Asimina triloba]
MAATQLRGNPSHEQIHRLHLVKPHLVISRQRSGPRPIASNPGQMQCCPPSSVRRQAPAPSNGSTGQHSRPTPAEKSVPNHPGHQRLDLAMLGQCCLDAISKV